MTTTNDIEKLQFDLGRCQEWLIDAHAELDWMGVPRDGLTLYGRIELLHSVLKVMLHVDEEAIRKGVKEWNEMYE